jgi:hypothetical protein
LEQHSSSSRQKKKGKKPDLTLFWGGEVTPIFSFIFLLVALKGAYMPNFSFIGCLEVVDLWLESKAAKKFYRINGFLSLQVELRLELGFRLRLTKKIRLRCAKVRSS